MLLTSFDFHLSWKIQTLSDVLILIFLFKEKKKSQKIEEISHVSSSKFIHLVLYVYEFRKSFKVNENPMDICRIFWCMVWGLFYLSKKIPALNKLLIWIKLNYFTENSLCFAFGNICKITYISFRIKSEK